MCFSLDFYRWLVQRLFRGSVGSGSVSAKQKAHSAKDRGAGSSVRAIIVGAFYLSSLGGCTYLVWENYDLFLDAMDGYYSGGPMQFRSPDWRELVDFTNNPRKVAPGSLWTGFMRTLGGLSLTSPGIRYGALDCLFGA